MDWKTLLEKVQNGEPITEPIEEKLKSSIARDINKMGPRGLRQWSYGSSKRAKHSFLKALFLHNANYLKNINWAEVEDSDFDIIDPNDARRKPYDNHVLFWISKSKKTLQKDNPEWLNRGYGPRKLEMEIPANSILGVTHGKRHLSLGGDKESGKYAERIGQSNNDYGYFLDNTKKLQDASDVVYGLSMERVKGKLSTSDLRKERALLKAYDMSDKDVAAANRARYKEILAQRRRDAAADTDVIGIVKELLQDLADVSPIVIDMVINAGVNSTDWYTALEEPIRLNRDNVTLRLKNSFTSPIDLLNYAKEGQGALFDYLKKYIEATNELAKAKIERESAEDDWTKNRAANDIERHEKMIGDMKRETANIAKKIKADVAIIKGLKELKIKQRG